ncbi:GAP family protein [Arthrobacter sp. Sr24]
MTTALYAQLALLALIDSTSIGTLLIPLWLLLRPDARRILPRILLYLGVLAGFYLLVGVAILSGAGWAISSMNAGSLTQIPAVQWAMVIGGGSLLAYALRPDPAKKRAKVALSAGKFDAGSGTQVPAPAELKWQKRLSTALCSPGGMVGLALVAGLLELPTMVPYLVAIGFLSNSTLPLLGAIGLLVAYCLLMLVPALILLGLRAAVGTKLDPLLHRVSAKMGKFSSETVLWVLGIVGFLLLRGGLSALAPAAAWNPFK